MPDASRAGIIVTGFGDATAAASDPIDPVAAGSPTTSEGSWMVRRSLLIVSIAAVVAFSSLPASAITNGDVDGTRHPNVGVLSIPGADGTPRPWCTGTLIAAKVVLTAAHCTVALPAAGIDRIAVTFDPVFDPARGTFYAGSFVTHPGFDPNTSADDIAVVLLDRGPRITPAKLPAAGQLAEMRRRGTLERQTFVNVGYGGILDTAATPPEIVYDGTRRASTSPYLGLDGIHLRLQTNVQATGMGGTCFGDSGGPHFVGTSAVVASVTSWGDGSCRALDQTQRTDTPSVRAFLGRFVKLP